MRLLIVNLHFDIGGVETLLVRLIPLLKERGVDITLLLLQNKYDRELIELVKPHCRVIFFKDAFPFTKRHLENFFAGDFDVVLHTIARALILGSWLLGIVKYKAKVSLLAYQTEIFCSDYGKNYFHQKLVGNIVSKKIHPGCIIFGNKAGRDYHQTKLGVDLSAAPVIPLFVDVSKYKFIDRSSLARKKIVSIGRFTPFKTYNFTMLPVIKSLLEQGHDIEWHVYGDGEQLDLFRKSVAEMGLFDRVFAHGALQYSMLQSVLEDAFVFVGSGTALIEAAACGVPSLTTIEYSDKAVTYGFISEIEGFSLIEPGLELQLFLIEDRLLEIIRADGDAYIAYQQACKMKSELYGGATAIHEFLRVFSCTLQKGQVVYVGFDDLVKSIFSFSMSKAGF